MRWPLVAGAVAALLAFAFSISHPLSLAGSYTRYESLPMRLAYLGLLVSAAWLLRTHFQREVLIVAFVFGTTVASAEAIQQWLGRASFRPDGNLGNANLLAALIAMAIPLAFDRGLRLRWASAVFWLAAVVMVAGLITTTSRSGVFGALAGLAAAGTMRIRRRGLFIVGAAAGTSAVAIAALAIQLSPLSTLNGDPASLRLNLWRDGLHMIASRPLTGWGEDATGLAFGRFVSGDYASLVTFDRIHSGPLDIAATQGLIGLAALAWVLVVIFTTAWRRRLESQVPGLGGALVGYSVWVLFNFDWAPATGAFWLLAGALWAAAQLPDRRDEPASTTVKTPDRRDDPAFVPRTLAAVLLAALAVVLGPLPILADIWYIHGRADLSVRADPFQAEYRWALAEGLIARGDLAGGVAELHAAADLGETEPGLYVELGDREVQLGDRAAARAAYRRALEVDPYYTPARQRLTALGA
ncbi:MAG TPA: O-antigen ligase family protein [Candidatus Dormibacteraeota bacterium]|nr:O-antigen ligase family protein [Candidatus Dormibacteraeota bacterium]